jgi:hypothetical protein
MRCPYLTGKYCKAVKHAYIPSILEHEEYCMTPRHVACPSFRNRDLAADTGHWPTIWSDKQRGS